MAHHMQSGMGMVISEAPELQQHFPPPLVSVAVAFTQACSGQRLVLFVPKRSCLHQICVYVRYFQGFPQCGGMPDSTILAQVRLIYTR